MYELQELWKNWDMTSQDMQDRKLGITPLREPNAEEIFAHKDNGHLERSLLQSTYGVHYETEAIATESMQEDFETAIYSMDIFD